MQIKDLGLIDYPVALGLQEQAVAEIRVQRAQQKPVQELILVCEHPAVITVGRAIGAGEEVFSKDIPVFDVSRGGRATLHLPGQIVVYPILDLSARGRDLHAYMRLLERAIIDTLADFRIEAGRVPDRTGVWVERTRKIASIGIAAREWISYHGLALNVICDLSLFKNLNPCGFESGIMTSVLKELPQKQLQTWALGPARLFKDVKTRLAENLVELLNLPSELQQEGAEIHIRGVPSTNGAKP